MSALAALTLRTLSGTLRDADLLSRCFAPVGVSSGSPWHWATSSTPGR